MDKSPCHGERWLAAGDSGDRLPRGVGVVKGMNLRDFLGVGLVSGFMVALFVLFWKAIPTENEQLIVYMLGQLSGFVAGVVSYHYVMSKTSEKATENTGKAFDAITAAANATGSTEPVAEAAQDVADAAQIEADVKKGRK